MSAALEAYKTSHQASSRYAVDEEEELTSEQEGDFVVQDQVGGSEKEGDSPLHHEPDDDRDTSQ